jgi:hypothetical protein
MQKFIGHNRVGASYQFGRHSQHHRRDHPCHALMLGRVVSFGGTAYIINTRALECANVLDTIVLGRVISLGGTNQHHWHDHPHHTPTQKFI